MSQETNRTPETRNKKPNYKLRRWGAGALATVAVLAGGDRILNASDGANRIGSRDKTIEFVDISVGAHLRSGPFVPQDPNVDPNNLIATTKEPIRLKANDNILVSTDNNGEWDGVPKAALERVIDDPELKKALEHNPAKIIYINEQKTTNERSQTSEVDLP